jgi:uncharacterized protein
MLFKFFLLLLLPHFLTALSGYHEPWGRDSDLHIKPKEITTYPNPSTATKVARQVILFHQKVISPIDGPRSHFLPCSSQYMKISMLKHGFFKGFLMGCDRLLRENKDPWIYRKVTINGQIIKYDPPR